MNNQYVQDEKCRTCPKSKTEVVHCARHVRLAALNGMDPVSPLCLSIHEWMDSRPFVFKEHHHGTEQEEIIPARRETHALFSKKKKE
jgi:hypothetical protein